MNHEVEFILSSEAAGQLDQILAAHGLRFVRLSRETFEVLDKSHPYAGGGGDHEKFHGVLEYHAREFPCSIEKRAAKQILSVAAHDLEDKSGNEVIQLLERIFPQPRRGILNTPKPERGVDKGEILGLTGCLAVLVLIVGILCLAVVGALSVLR